MRRPTPFAVGLATFYTSLIALSLLWPMACADGWLSSSIGRQGACSWHGGISLFSRFSLYIVLPVSLALAFVSSRIAAGPAKKNTSVPAERQSFTVGVHVEHPSFGEGKIVRQEGEGRGARLLIDFGGTFKKIHLETAVNCGMKVISR